MRAVHPSFRFVGDVDGGSILRHIEECGRVCYQSENKATEDSAEKFIAGIIRRGHESVLEHEKITVRIICDRGISHELVRHRIASYSQESTRYCNYGKNGELTFIIPCYWEDDPVGMALWEAAMRDAEERYLRLLLYGAKPEEARCVLPNSLKTEIAVTMNLREWRHFFKLRTDRAAHPQMREIAYMLLRGFKEKIPVVFDDIPDREADA